MRREILITGVSAYYQTVTNALRESEYSVVPVDRYRGLMNPGYPNRLKGVEALLIMADYSADSIDMGTARRLAEKTGMKAIFIIGECEDKEMFSPLEADEAEEMR